MLKVTYLNTMNYSFDATRKGAKYLIGDAYKNHGEFLESVAKCHRGLEYFVNPATAWNEGSDIEEINASVKSSGASLGCIYGENINTILDVYFNEVHSTLWIFINDMNDEITEYHMNDVEFRQFLETFGVLARESKTHLQKVRIKKVSGKMLEWLDARC